jgi:hypothetical protein
VITAEGLSISPIRKNETDQSENVARRLYGMLPRLRITGRDKRNAMAVAE